MNSHDYAINQNRLKLNAIRNEKISLRNQIEQIRLRNDGIKNSNILTLQKRQQLDMNNDIISNLLKRINQLNQNEHAVLNMMIALRKKVV